MDACRATLLILLAASCEAVVAQSDLAINESATNSQKHKNILVMLDGQIISGHVTPRPDGYDVQVAAGRIFINSDRVRFAANSLPDAYDRMRDSISDFTPADHLALARWCLENKLHSQARREVLDALYLNPNLDDAKRMLQSLELVGQASPQSNTGTGFTEYPSLSDMQRSPIETRSLAGLSRSVAHSFVRDVQPLLMNKCATSGCHGVDTSSQFAIVSTHRGSTPAIAERNLAAVLKQIDFSDPMASALLVVGEQPHGKMTWSTFQGRAGALQIKTLNAWVQQAAHDIAPDVRSEAVGSGFGEAERPQTAIKQVAATGDSLIMAKTLRTPEVTPENPHTRQLTTDDTDRRFLREAEYANRKDAFSPEEFNRRFHGLPDRDSTDSSVVGLKLTSKSENRTEAQVP